MSAPGLPPEPSLIDALWRGLNGHRDAVLQAPTGAGKSTRVPLALLDELRRETRGGGQDQRRPCAGARILMLEPRRLAARALATRMASLLGERPGATVGYRMRLDSCISAATRIEVVTEGVLTRLLQEDPALEGVAWLIFDEYHERSLQADLGLALALDARRQLGAAFRVLVMSATLQPARVAALLEDAAVVSVPGRTFEIGIRYLGRGAPLLPAGGADAAALARAVARATALALAESAGDVLVFLPGAGEIRRVAQLLAAETAPAQAAAPQRLLVLPLHGQLDLEAQQAALAPAPPGARKVVLATNVAQTSLTLPGITAVIDSGLARRSRFDPASGMSRLELTRISRASAEQRAGRAGRTGPGRCYRLWGEGAHASLAADDVPEILEADLAPLALELARWGADDTASLRWLDAPPAAALAQARELLRRLEALDGEGRLTVRGQQLARLPVHPRLAHMLLVARALGCVPLAARLAALLSERDLLPARDGQPAGPADPGSDRRSSGRDPDLRTRLERLLEAEAAGAGGDSASKRLRRSVRALEEAVRQLSATKPTIVLPHADLPGALLAMAFPDRIGRRRDGAGPDRDAAAARYLLVNGRGAAFTSPVALVREPLIVAVQVDDREREGRIELAVPLAAAALEALFARQIVTEDSFGWDEGVQALVGRCTRRLGALVLEERLLPQTDPVRAVPAMLDVIRRLGLEVLPWDTESRSLQARLQFARLLARPDLGDWPASDAAALLATLPQWLGPYLHGITRRAALARVPLREALLARLSAPQRRALEALAPRELTVPSGSSIRIDYLDEQAPCLPVRLQELFGLADTPRIGGGAVAVTLKLLSPARRPVQITRDLAGFWRSGYAVVRKDLRGRYPKHHWPEDPLQAVAGRGPHLPARSTPAQDPAPGSRARGSRARAPGRR